MIKQEIRSLARNSLPKVDKTNRWHDRYIDAAIEKALASMYHDIFTMNPLGLQRYTKGYGYTTPIVVNTQVSTGRKYCTLPESIIPLEDKSSGVRRISTPINGPFMFFPMDAREMDLVANGCYFDTTNTKVGYIVTQTEVEFYNIPASIVASGVRMDLLVPFSKYGEDDEVKIPEITDISGWGNKTASATFMDRVMQILGVVQPVDLRDDNAPREGAQKDN
jgi:hypothetical protein